MTPDYEFAAEMALDTLYKYGIDSAPVAPLPILKQIPGVLVVTYESMSQAVDQDRRCVMDLFGEKNQDAFTSFSMDHGKPRYLVTYNQRLPIALIQRALARELGHIILGHDGSRPEDVRNEEAKCFANHLLVPRPLIHALQAMNIRITVEVLGNVTGCYDFCLSCLRKLPAVHPAAELNRAVRDQFLPYIKNLFEYQRYAMLSDGSALADFGTFMEGYEE